MKKFWTTYQHGLVPGPTSVRDEVLKAYATNFAASDVEADFFSLYAIIQLRLQKLLQTNSSIVIMTGEAMVTLWGALKSVLVPGDTILAIGTGLYGEGFGEMAAMLGAKVIQKNFDWTNPRLSTEMLAEIRQIAQDSKPKLITTVHCETPSGSINIAVPEIGKIASDCGALFCVDAVSSVGALPVLVDEWHIDLALVGSQKALSCPPDFSFMSVSPKAWEIIRQVKYCGYDALLPFDGAPNIPEFPYTPCWSALAALDVTLDAFDHEGIDQVYERHSRLQAYTIKRLESMGIDLYVTDPELRSASVTAAWLPGGWSWEQLDSELRKHGVVFGGSYGKIAKKVFRVGHMGTQADELLVRSALDILEQVLTRGPPTTA